MLVAHLKRAILLVLLVLVCVYIYYYCFLYTNLKNGVFLNTIKMSNIENGRVSNNNTIPNDNRKLILYWNKCGSHNYPIGVGGNPFLHCEYKNCFTTYNRSLVNIEDFDAVVFHGSTYNQRVHGKPKVRNLKQRYIYYNTEAPANQYNPNSFDSFYNWTITYRLDSDFSQRYGLVSKRKTNRTLPSLDDVQKKTKLIAWFVSNCNTSSKREDLVKEMQKYVPVDIYGKCGNLSCPKKGYISTDDCYNMLQNTYKFYLSFENSLCKDYFTEKLYYILKKDILPIVYAGNDDTLNTLLVPPNSVINARDFKSVKALTDYIKFLDANTLEYLKYFEWRQSYAIVDKFSNCDLCEKLNQPVTTKIYNHFYDSQWGNSSHPICNVGNNLPPIVKKLG